MGNVIRAQVETYFDAKKGYIRVRPVPGQGLKENFNVRFPRALRSQFETGQKFFCDIEEKRGHYILKGEIELVQKITFSHGGKKKKEEVTLSNNQQTKNKTAKVKETKKPEVPKLGQRKLKF